MGQETQKLSHSQKSRSDAFSITLIVFLIFYSLYLFLPFMTIDGANVRGFFLAGPLGAATLAYSVFYISMRDREIHKKYWVLFKIMFMVLFVFSSFDTFEAFSASLLIQVDGVWWGALLFDYGADCFLVSAIAFVVLLIVRPRFSAKNGDKSTRLDQSSKEIGS